MIVSVVTVVTVVTAVTAELVPCTYGIRMCARRSRSKIELDSRREVQCSAVKHHQYHGRHGE